MMELNLMKQFFQTVDEEWRSPIASAITERWLADRAETWVWRASANFVCIVVADDRRYYMRFNHESERSPDAITAELSFINQLNASDILLSMPVMSRADRLLETVETPLGLCHAVLFEALPGEQRELTDLDANSLEAWGNSLGMLHTCSSRVSTLSRPNWYDLLSEARDSIPVDEERAHRELQSLEQRLKGTPQNSNNYGLIHYDFELDNLTWDNGLVYALDFDDCVYHWFVADIAYALRDLFGDSVSGIKMDDPTLTSFVRGYRKAKWLSDEELERIPLMLRLHNLVSFGRIMRSLGETLPDDELVWAADLRGKLLGVLAAYREDILKHPI